MNLTTSALLNDVSSAWASWMLGMTWLVALLVVLLSLISLAFKRRSASLLYVLWLVVLVRLIMPPELAFPTGWGWWIRSNDKNVSATATPHEDRKDPSFGDSLEEQVAPAAARETAEVESPAAAPVPYALVLMIAWLGIVAARGGMLLTAALQVHVWVSRAHPIGDPVLLELLDECRRRVGVRRPVELRNSEACSTPLVVGVWQPVLLLPSTVLDRLNTEQLRSVLIHELHHVKRWDGLVNLLQGVLGAVYFFHPAVWWANRRIRQLREDACDERTVAVMKGNRKPYGEAIFKVAEILGYSAPPLTLGVLDSKSPLTQRLKRILDPRLPTPARSPWQSTGLLLVAVAVLLPAGTRPAASLEDATMERIFVAELPAETPPESLEEPEAKQETIETVPAEEFRQEVPTMPESRDDSAAVERPVEEIVRDLSVPDCRTAAVESLAAFGPAAESALLDLLKSADSDTRWATYQVLASVGTEHSILPLQQALLDRETFEQRRIEHALDAIYGRLQVTSTVSEPSVNSTRLFEADESEEDW